MTILNIFYADQRKFFKLECDQCKKEFEKKYNSHIKNKKFHFCCNECSKNARRSGGVIREKTKETCLKRYGVDHPWKSKEIQKKKKETFVKNYGTDNPLKSKEIQEKIKKTCLKKYGTNCPLESKEIQVKIKKTCAERYGTNYPSQSKKIQEKIKKTCLKKYGTNCPLESKEIQVKIKKTCVERYGTENPFGSEEIRKKIDWKNNAAKSHVTMKKNGTYRKSSVEDKFYDFLCYFFEKDNVKRQVNINDWNIDFYVKSIDTYIQLDGVYWHGLDRSIEIVKEFKSSRDKVIYETYLRDQKQIEWFKQNNMTLIRFTDIEFEESLKSSDLLRICKRILNS